jgi:transposase
VATPAAPARRSIRVGIAEAKPGDIAARRAIFRFAALDVASGKVISATHRRHRHQEFLKFLRTIDRNVPAELDVHLVCDNYGTHKTPEIKRWLLRHPRFQLHLTPTDSSWLNLVERWFAELTTRKLRRSAHRSVAEQCKLMRVQEERMGVDLDVGLLVSAEVVVAEQMSMAPLPGWHHPAARPGCGSAPLASSARFIAAAAGSRPAGRSPSAGPAG